MNKSKQSKALKSKQLHVKCKRSWSVLFISLAVLTMLGCSNSMNSLKPVIPANLIQPCSTLGFIEGTTGKDLMIWSVDTVAKYNDCKARHAALVKASQQ